MNQPALVPTLLLLALLPGLACTPEPTMSHSHTHQPPQAAEQPLEMQHHGETRIDPWYWLRDDERDDPQVLAHLQAENAFTEAQLAPSAKLRQQLKAELEARIDPEDASVPVRDGDWIYRVRYRAGDDYPLHERQPASGGDWQLLVDENREAEGSAHYQLGGLSLSPDATRMALAEDRVGRWLFSLRVQDLSSGQWWPETIANTSGEVAWSADGHYLFYLQKDLDTLLPNRLYRHRLGSNPALDQLVFEEKRSGMVLSLGNSRSDRFILISSSATDDSETLMIPADQPQLAPVAILPLQPQVLYDVEDHGELWLLHTNDAAPDYRILARPIADHAAPWQELVAARRDTIIEEMLVQGDHLCLLERQQGRHQIRLLPLPGSSGSEQLIRDDNPLAVFYFGANPDASQPRLRYGRESMSQPYRVMECDLVSASERLLKQDKLGVPYDASAYRSARISVTARDGTAIPVSLVWHQQTPINGSAPLLLYGYGAYGITIDPTFASERLSLLDRGFVYAIAHVRGGGMLGRAWYDAGRLANKMNSFTDFVDVADGLVALSYGAPDKIVAKGGSAGGLLVTAATNLNPGRFAAVVAEVPFVDVLTSMLDETIPLTTEEYREWGDPRIPEQYAWIRSYSPYDNLKAVDYPAMLVMSGLHDSQVQYWEPTKYVAKLRSLRRDSRPTLLWTNLTAGHHGSAGRFESLDEVALSYSFILQQLGLGSE